MKNQLKALELDPTKTYLIIVGKGFGISREELHRFPKETIGKESVFFIVDDINNIKVEELDNLQDWIDYKREKLTSS